jgi:hypothetical protein
LIECAAIRHSRPQAIFRWLTGAKIAAAKTDDTTASKAAEVG